VSTYELNSGYDLELDTKSVMEKVRGEGKRGAEHYLAVF
jgi:hypothetical protein